MMTRSYFEEIQHFRENRWLMMVVLLISTGVILPVSFGLHTQLIEGRPWGDKPMSDGGLIMLFVFMLINVTLVTGLLFMMKLEMRIDEEGVHYRFVPLKNKWQLIKKEQISGYLTEKKLRLFVTGGTTHHRNIFTKTRSYRIRGLSHLYLKLHNGEKILLGTQNLPGVEWAMKKLMTTNQLS